MRSLLHRHLAWIAVLALGLLAAGCTHSARRNSTPSFGNRVAIALTVNSTEQPNPEQWATLLAAVQPHLAAYGLVLVDDLRQADRIIRIDFTPSDLDPNTSGRATVLGWRANPLNGYGYANSVYSSFSPASYTSGMWAYSNSPYGFDRYPNGGYSSGMSGGSAGGSTTVTTNPPAKPSHPGYGRDDRPPGPPNHRGYIHDDRPRDKTPPASGNSGRYAGGDRPDRSDRGSHPHPAPPASPPSYASSSGSSSSYSAPSYSSSSSSSSGSYSSSSSSGSGSSSSGSTSSGSNSSGSNGVTAQRNQP